MVNDKSILKDRMVSNLLAVLSEQDARRFLTVLLFDFMLFALFVIRLLPGRLGQLVES